MKNEDYVCLGATRVAHKCSIICKIENGKANVERIKCNNVGIKCHSIVKNYSGPNFDDSSNLNLLEIFSDLGFTSATVGEHGDSAPSELQPISIDEWTRPCNIFVS